MLSKAAGCETYIAAWRHPKALFCFGEFAITSGKRVGDFIHFNFSGARNGEVSKLLARIQSSTQSRPQQDCRGQRRQPPRCRRGNDCVLCSHNKGGFHWAPEYSEASERRSYPLSCGALLFRRASQIRVGMVLWERLKPINSSHGRFTHLCISRSGRSYSSRKLE